MPGSTTTRGQHVACGIEIGCCLLLDGKHQRPELSYAAQAMAASRRFQPAAMRK
jgi:hypothetical protein